PRWRAGPFSANRRRRRPDPGSRGAGSCARESRRGAPGAARESRRSSRGTSGPSAQLPLVAGPRDWGAVWATPRSVGDDGSLPASDVRNARVTGKPNQASASASRPSGTARCTPRAEPPLSLCILLKRERPHGTLRGHEHILSAVHGIGLRSVLDRADLGMPQRRREPPPAQAKGPQTPGSVVGEQQPARRGEQPAAIPSHEGVFPGALARLVVDRDDGRAERPYHLLLA